MPEIENRLHALIPAEAASGLHHPGTETLGTVASALAVRAHCSVEIVRP